MLTLAWGLFLLVLLAGAGAVLAALLDCDAALLPLPLLSAAALVLYPFGMLGNLRIGAAAAVLLLGAAVVVGVVRLRPAGVGTAVKTALTRPGFALFLGGVVFGSAGFKVLSSKDAKKVYTQTTAAVLRMKDCTMQTVNKVQEEAGDILADAKAINESRAAEAAQEVIKDTAAEDVAEDQTAE